MALRPLHLTLEHLGAQFEARVDLALRALLDFLVERLAQKPDWDC